MSLERVLEELADESKPLRYSGLIALSDLPRPFPRARLPMRDKTLDFPVPGRLTYMQRNGQVRNASAKRATE